MVGLAMLRSNLVSSDGDDLDRFVVHDDMVELLVNYRVCKQKMAGSVVDARSLYNKLIGDLDFSLTEK